MVIHCKAARCGCSCEAPADRNYWLDYVALEVTNFREDGSERLVAVKSECGELVAIVNN